VPLYQLWVSYFKSLLAHCNEQLDERLLRMDFHGAILRVSDSPNKTQVIFRILSHTDLKIEGFRRVIVVRKYLMKVHLKPLGVGLSHL